MARTEALPSPAEAVPARPGLGLWNLYFLAKFALAWGGTLNLHALPNLLLAAALLLPLKPRWLSRLRHLAAVPAAVALCYYDTWLPPFARLLGAPGVLDFTPGYLLELAGRFVDWHLLGLLALLVLGYVLLAPWLRLTTVSLAGLLWLALLAVPRPAGWTAATEAAQASAPAASGSAPASQNSGPADNATLDAYLARFYQDEAARHTEFPAPAADAEPFDLLVINICSLAWDDLDEVGLRDNTLLRKMDVVFDDFDSATSYSGPAAIRLLRASCGQGSHAQLYQPADPRCELFENLARLGFSDELALNHDGHFDHFLDELHQQGGLAAAPFDTSRLPRALSAFDGSPIKRDHDVLAAWWQHRLGERSPRTALFYNTISLHDGNRLLGADGRSGTDYRPRAQQLFDDLSRFVDELARSGRRVALVIVPEHGAALRGDRMQIPGLREIPSPAITHVPVAVKLIGMGTPPMGGPLHVAAPSSYLAISELVSRLYAASAQHPAAYDWQALLRDLPQTAPEAEDEGAKVIEYAGKPHVQLKGESEWLPYPQNP
ncbi:cellulose biosynthesis protein BcsG [Frateuria defendens]|uniref:cellulose biosynthesis protein BcsG n=1 Tax=Frateuria defendens TaxID=2219559 RepID=UPI00066FBE93|nr:cellulose biosynthesis protein BcsG [Frateuria defendens]